MLLKKIYKTDAKNRSIYLFFTTIIAILLMTYIDTYIKPTYIVKSILKIIIFIGSVAICTYRCGFSIKSVLKCTQKPIYTILFSVGVFSLIGLSYIAVGKMLNMGGVEKMLSENFSKYHWWLVGVGVYIAFINSALEEIFFRGLCFCGLRQNSRRRTAYIFSALSFSLYHISIIGNWFSPLLFLLLLLALFVAGLIFACLAERSGGIFVPWMVHMSANLAINLIGMDILLKSMKNSMII